jgi:hypothetical protein
MQTRAPIVGSSGCRILRNKTTVYETLLPTARRPCWVRQWVYTGLTGLSRPAGRHDYELRCWALVGSPGREGRSRGRRIPQQTPQVYHPVPVSEVIGTAAACDFKHPVANGRGVPAKYENIHCHRLAIPQRQLPAQKDMSTRSAVSAGTATSSATTWANSRNGFAA